MDKEAVREMLNEQIRCIADMVGRADEPSQLSTLVEFLINDVCRSS